MTTRLVIFPNNTADDQPDVALADAKHITNFPLKHLPSGVQVSNLFRILDRESMSAQNNAINSVSCYRAANVRPFFACDNVGNCATGYTESLPQFIMRHIALSVCFADFYHLFVGKYRHAMSDSLLMSLAILAVSVCAIISLCSSKKMIWIATKRGVAFMADEQTVWNWAVRQLVSNAMGSKHFAIIGLIFPISLDGRSLPQPTIIWPALIDVRPETFGKWGFETFGVMTR